MHFKQNNKESKTYVQGLRSFGNTLPRGVKQILKKNGYNYSEIISKWSILVGKDIASYCYPKSIKMTNGGKNGILILSNNIELANSAPIADPPMPQTSIELISLDIILLIVFLLFLDHFDSISNDASI